MLNEYLARIPTQHRQKDKYIATVQALIQPLCDIDVLLQELRTAFDLDLAVGKQLDAVGVRVGLSRHLRIPIDAYFSWNTKGFGWDEGVWKGLYDPDTGLIALPDDTYRILLKTKIVSNHWDGTITGAYRIWESAFTEEGSSIIIQDNQDMSMIVGITGVRLNPVLEQLLLQGYIPLKPEGVRINWYAITPEGGALFAWDCNSPSLAGWNEGSFPVQLQPTIQGE